jgi:hypothetical protein
MLHKVKKQILEQRNRFSHDRKIEYIVRRYDMDGNVVEDIMFDNALHAGLMKRALRGARTPISCSLMRREYEVNSTDEGDFNYISVEKSV